MKKRFALIALLPLAGCGGTTPIVTGDAVGCATALLAAGVASPAALLPIALATPACRTLAAEVMQAVIADVSRRQLARGIRQ
jgi:hypothetical protein